MLTFNILTIFPEIFTPVETGVLGRAADSSLLKINKINIRDFSKDNHRNTDDYPYGGGDGMLMTAQPLFDAWKSIERPGRTIILSPRGKTLDQKKSIELSKLSDITLVCGRYEGMDERVNELIADEELSVGDYVMTGGELAAMIVIDSVSRMMPGVLGNSAGGSRDSHYDGLLEYPQYTRPETFKDLSVPGVLLSGNHAKIIEYRFRESLSVTWKRRPDMIKRRGLSDNELSILMDMFPDDEEELINIRRIG